jgi:Mg2+-importing ATPase
MLHSCPHKYVAFMACGVAALALILPFTPLGAWFGLAPLPAIFFVFLAGAVTAYFVLVEAAKHIFRRII